MKNFITGHSEWSLIIERSGRPQKEKEKNA